MFNIFNKMTNIYSPIKGVAKELTAIDDPVFSKGIMGTTLAFVPQDNKIYAPIDGEITMVFPTLHAMGIKYNDIEILIHIGIDTVKLQGEGFKLLIKEGQKIKRGDLLMEVDFDLIRQKGFQNDVIMVITQAKKTVLNKINEVDNEVIVGKCA